MVSTPYLSTSRRISRSHDARGLGLRVQVALGVRRGARVGDDQPGDVVAGSGPGPRSAPAGSRMPSPKCSFALTSNEPGTRAADVGPVAVGLRVGDHLAVGEDRADDADVVEVRAAAGRGR